MKIKDCNLRKIITCSGQDNIVTIAKRLKDNNERHIVVVESNKPLGIVSTTDICNRAVAEGKDTKKVKAQEIMTSKIIIHDSEESLAKAYIEMIKENVYSCLITSKGKLLGTLDLKEVMNKLANLRENGKNKKDI